VSGTDGVSDAHLCYHFHIAVGAIPLERGHHSRQRMRIRRQARRHKPRSAACAGDHRSGRSMSRNDHQGLGKARAEFRDFRLHHRRGRQRRVRSGQSADSVGPAPCASVGGGPQRSAPVASYSTRLWQAFRRSQVQLVLRDRAATRVPQSASHRAARQGSWRLQLDQWTDLYPRTSGGFQPLATTGQCRLEFR
jgi:hypothetical protein